MTTQRLEGFFGPTGAPDNTTVITTGTGTFTPAGITVMARITLVGGGAPGENGSTSTSDTALGGAAGATLVAVVRLTGGQPYSVAAAAAPGSPANATTFGALMAPGGTSSGFGGGYDPAAVPNIMALGPGLPGGAGGGTPGGAKTAGRAPGLPHRPADATVPLGGGSAGADDAGYLGGSGGGSSQYGKGGDGGAANDAGVGAPGFAGDGYGSGGGGGGAGSLAGGPGASGQPGVIIVEEWIL